MLIQERDLAPSYSDQLSKGDIRRLLYLYFLKIQTSPSPCLSVQNPSTSFPPHQTSRSHWIPPVPLPISLNYLTSLCLPRGILPLSSILHLRSLSFTKLVFSIPWTSHFVLTPGIMELKFGYCWEAWGLLYLENSESHTAFGSEIENLWKYNELKMGRDVMWVKQEFITQWRWALFFVNTRAVELTREDFVKVSWKPVRCDIFAQ